MGMGEVKGVTVGSSSVVSLGALACI